jgi:hypothetical protein
VPSQKIATFPFDLFLLIPDRGRSASIGNGFVARWSGWTGVGLRFSRATRQIGNRGLGHRFCCWGFVSRHGSASGRIWGDFGGEMQITHDQLVCRNTISVFLPTLSGHIHLIHFEHFEKLNIVQKAVTVQSTGRLPNDSGVERGSH